MKRLPQRHKLSVYPKIALLVLISLVFVGVYRVEISEWLVDEKFSAFFGSLLGALTSILVWVFASRDAQNEKQTDRDNFKKVVWNELMSFYSTMHKEALWWHTTTGEPSTGEEKEFEETQKRVLSGFELRVIDANLNRLTELEPETTDGIIGILGRVRILHQAGIKHEEMERRLQSDLQSVMRLRGPGAIEKQNETFKIALEAQYKSRRSLTILLVSTAYAAHAVAYQMDSDGSYERNLRSKISKKDWYQLIGELDELKLLYKRYEADKGTIG